MKLRTLAAAGVLSIFAIASAGCASSKPDSDSGGEAASGGLVIQGEQIADETLLKAALEKPEIVVYSSSGEKAQRSNDAVFTEDTGIAVEAVTLSPSRLKERILSEAGANQFPGEVVIISDPQILQELTTAKIFTKHDLPESFGIDAAVKHDGGTYYTAYYPAYTLAYNTEALKGSPPESWADLLDPRFKGQLGIVDVNVGGSAAAVTRFQFQTLGDSYLKQYAAQEARIYDTMAAEAEGMGRGEILIGSMTTRTATNAAADGAPVKAFVPKEGFAVYDYFIGLTQAGADSAAAKVYLNWFFSKRGQETQLAEGSYSVRSDVRPPELNGEPMPVLGSKEVFRMSPDEAVAARTPDLNQWNSIFSRTS